jgi:hypothetical protein
VRTVRADVGGTEQNHANPRTARLLPLSQRSLCPSNRAQAGELFLSARNSPRRGRRTWRSVSTHSKTIHAPGKESGTHRTGECLGLGDGVMVKVLSVPRIETRTCSPQRVASLTQLPRLISPFHAAGEICRFRDIITSALNTVTTSVFRDMDDEVLSSWNFRSSRRRL